MKAEGVHSRVVGNANRDRAQPRCAAKRTDITDYVSAKGWHLSEVFCDPGLSGTLSTRPALQTLMSRAAQCEFDVVIVNAIDRIYRDLSELLAALHHLHELSWPKTQSAE